MHTGVFASLILGPESSKQEDQEMQVRSCFLGVRICTTLQVYSADYAVPRLLLCLLQDGQCPGNREIENELK